MDKPTAEIDTGVAYGMKPATYRKELVEVGPGTPMGELMRRYWQPVFASEVLTSDRPRRVRVLGEDLILFRDKSGRPGLMHEHCCHRGSSLYYGRIEDDGIRCCYHGWKFDPTGRCLDQPAEVGGGQNRHRVRQPWYPVQERYGLVYAYMGPPEKKPALQRWEVFENLGPDETVEVRWIPPYGPIDTATYEMPQYDFNWLAAYENTMDGPHVPWLHYHHSGDQFTKIKLTDSELPPYAVIKDLAGSMRTERTEFGVRSGMELTGPNGEKFLGGNEALIPNMVFIPGFIDLMYVVPADDVSYTGFMLWRSKTGAERSNIVELHDGKTWWEMTPEEHQRMPGDYEAQSSIGRVPPHSREHLSAGDVGLVNLRRRLEAAVRDVAEGRDPPGVSFDPAAPPIRSRARRLSPKEAADYRPLTKVGSED